MYDNPWAIVTLLGDPILSTSVVICLTAIYFLLGHGHPALHAWARYKRPLKKLLMLIIPALFISMVGTEMLKLIFQVPRPCMLCPAPGCNPYCPITFSFPSGHTATITGIVTALSLLWRRIRPILLLYSLPLLVAASRVALGVHTIADVVGGFVFGLAATLVIWRFRKKIYEWEDEIL